jgi:glycosyltransferase involved in cell wall biosynthesis
MSKIDIIISTFGEESWQKRGKKLATLTRKEVIGYNKVIVSHKDTLAMARNDGASLSKADYLIFLDADDYLDSMYVVRMMNESLKFAGPIIFQPSTRFISWDDSVFKDAYLIEDRDMFLANNLVIGSMVRKVDFEKVGGFKELPVLEDWELFLNLICNASAMIKTVPEAIYNVKISNGRNTHIDNTHLEIRKTYSSMRRQYRIMA